MRASVSTAGTQVGVECELPWVARLLAECCGDALEIDQLATIDTAQLRIRIERSRDPFDIGGLAPLTRAAWAGPGELVMLDVCTSGFDLRMRLERGRPVLSYRWRPPATTRAAVMTLRARFRLLARAALLQYPAMWFASTRGAVPLHAAVLSAGGATTLLAGPSGVGKTTVLMREVRKGGVATSDNLCVSDGTQCWGVVEPVRAEGATGRRMTHGRRETHLNERVDCLMPDVMVVLRRSVDGALAIRRCSAGEAARSLASGTYMAGELRRYWAFAATLATASGLGPAHPAITETSGLLSRRLACLEVALPEHCDMRLHEVLETVERSTCA
jgi:hypothetical protein